MVQVLVQTIFPSTTQHYFLADQTFHELIKVKETCKVHPITGHEGPEGEWRYSSTLSLTSTIDWRWVVNIMPRPLYPPPSPQKDPVPIVLEAGEPRPVWTGAENLTLTGIQSLDRPACSKSLYQLRYSSPPALANKLLNLNR